ncbi:MAG: hypothetical protein ACYTKC_09600 [Planctomycetota bacterium]|jgi:hypothetical protein
MSRRLITALTLPLLAAALAAQEGIQIYPASGSNPTLNGTSNATRLTFAAAAGEALAQYPKTHFEGIGDRSVAGVPGNPACALAYIVLYVQDQDQTTANNFGVVLRPAASAGGPNTNNTAAIFRFLNIPGPKGTATGPAGWAVSLQFQNQGVPTPWAIPCKGDLFFGIVLSANSKWPLTDGLSVWSAFYDPIGQAVPTRKGDNVPPRKGVPNLTWEISAAGKASQPAIPQVLDYILVSPYSMLQVGARHKPGQSNHGSNDGFGAAGLYPSISGGATGRQDGVVLRITDNPPGTAPTYGGQYLLFLSLSTAPQLTSPPIQLSGIFGSVYLGPLGQFPLGGGSLSTTGPQTMLLLAPPGAIPLDAATQKIKIYFQAATTRRNSPVVSITNLAGVYY